MLNNLEELRRFLHSDQDMNSNQNFNFFRKPILAFLTLILLVAINSNAWAWPPTYGAEFEVTKQGLKPFNAAIDIPSETNVKEAQMLFVNEMKKRCEISKCKIEKIKESWDYDYKVIYPDGWWFQISYDPGCVEFKFKPSTLETLQQKAALINDQIFKTAKDLGFKVTETEAGHFNIGVRSAFGDDPKRFLRFFVDYANHADLALGSLGKDLNNAPPLSVLGANQRQALQVLVDEVNSGKIATIEEVAQAIQDRVYTKSYYEPWGSPEHYQAIGIKYLYDADLKKKDVPMELRSMWGQGSAEKFNLIAKLMEGRIRYLNNQKGPIVYTATDKKEFTPAELKTRFAIYADEADLDYEEFVSLLPEKVRKAEFNDFIRNDVSIDRQMKDVERYWDLIPASEWVRDRIVDILSHPSSFAHPQRAELLEKMKQIVFVKKTNAVLSFMSGIADYFRTKDSGYSPEALENFRRLIARIETPATPSSQPGKPAALDVKFYNQCSDVFAL